VGLKALPATRTQGRLRVVDPVDARSGRGIFAHLKLRAALGEADVDVFDASPAVQALACPGDGSSAAWRTAADLITGDALACSR
jgi:hypothetical protein